MNRTASTYASAWDVIETEKRRDRLIRRTTVAAWAVTFIVLLVFAAMVAQRLALVMRRVAVGIEMPQSIYDTALPLVIVLGVVSLLIATLSTVGIFLRHRTASLSEIQLRLAMLEEILRSSGGEPAQGREDRSGTPRG